LKRPARSLEAQRRAKRALPRSGGGVVDLDAAKKNLQTPAKRRLKAATNPVAPPARQAGLIPLFAEKWTG